MAYTRDWEESNPDGTEDVSLGDNRIRNLKVELGERLEDLLCGFNVSDGTGDEATAGVKKLNFKEQSSAPSTPSANQIVIYALDDGSNCGLFAKEENGYTKQILKKVGTGILLDISDEVDGSTIELSSGKLQLKDDGITGAKMATAFQFTDLVKAKSATPTHDDHIVRKKYVDDTPHTGGVVQVVNAQTGANTKDTGLTAITNDDNVPQNNEGLEVLTLAITPNSATNKLKIEVAAFVESSSGTFRAAALFQDSIADALASGQGNGVGDVINPISFTYYMTAGTTSETTFKVRAGSDGTTVAINGTSSGRIYGGKMITSITITEIKV